MRRIFRWGLQTAQSTECTTFEKSAILGGCNVQIASKAENQHFFEFSTNEVVE